MTQSANTSSITPGRYSNLFRIGGNSPRVNGKLQLRGNTFKMYKTNGKSIIVTESCTVSPDFFNRSYPRKVAYYSGSVFANQTAPTATSSYDRTSLINSMRIELRNKIRSNDVNLAVAYAEKTQSAGLIKGTAQKLAKAADAAKRGNAAELRRHLGLNTSTSPRGYRRGGIFNASDLWLQYAYGWVPLYNDMLGSMIAADKAINTNPDTVYSVGTERSKFFRVESSETVKPFNLAVTSRIYRNCNHRFKLSARIKIDNPNMHTVDSLGLLNPLSVAWEKVPFSFVADWFMPIGSWLTQMPPLYGVSILECFLTMIADESSESFSVPAVASSNTKEDDPKKPGTLLENVLYSYTTVAAPGKKQFIFVERTIDNLNASLLPMRPQLPDSWRQAANALALLHTALKRLR